MCPGTESNCLHTDFQSVALPVELPGRFRVRVVYQKNRPRVSRRDDRTPDWLRRPVFSCQPPPAWRSRASARYSLRASGCQQLTRVEPVQRPHRIEHGRQVARELAVVGATVVPQGAAVRQRSEAKDFLHAAVAVGRDDQDAPGQRRASRHPHHDVVVKLALLPVVDQVVAAGAGPGAPTAARRDQVAETAPAARLKDRGGLAPRHFLRLETLTAAPRSSREFLRKTSCPATICRRPGVARGLLTWTAPCRQRAPPSSPRSRLACLPSRPHVAAARLDPAVSRHGRSAGAGGGQACGPVCDNFCTYGSVLDANGCPTCACEPDPGCPTIELNCGRIYCPTASPPTRAAVRPASAPRGRFATASRRRACTKSLPPICDCDPGRACAESECGGPPPPVQPAPCPDGSVPPFELRPQRRPADVRMAGQRRARRHGVTTARALGSGAPPDAPCWGPDRGVAFGRFRAPQHAQPACNPARLRVAAGGAVGQRHVRGRARQLRRGVGVHGPPAADRDEPRDYATPAEVECPTPRRQRRAGRVRRRRPARFLWYRMSRFAEPDPGGVGAAPARRPATKITGSSYGAPARAGSAAVARAPAGGAVRAADAAAAPRSLDFNADARDLPRGPSRLPNARPGPTRQQSVSARARVCRVPRAPVFRSRGVCASFFRES